MPEQGIYSITIKENRFEFGSFISEAMEEAKLELETLNDTIDSIKELKPDCDKLDYALAAGCGALCGVMDVFLVGKPGESKIENFTDKWFASRTEDFAKLCGWNGEKGNLSRAVRYLEKKFRIPYDQNGIGHIAKDILDLTPSNHHFKSLGHNPTLLGLFFSILDQFKNISHFVSEGEFITVSNFEGEFYLQGQDVPSKLFCGITNWLGHLMSDISGSSGSKGRGMGLPAPILAWSNDIIAIKRKLNVQSSEFDKAMNEIAVEIYKEGFDLRFQTGQLLPVLINELIARLVYSVRRMVRYFIDVPSKERSFKEMWKYCEPFSNATVRRMLTVAHGTFCLLDLGDAIIRSLVSGGGSFNIKEFFIRVNYFGMGRLVISLYGEVNRAISYSNSNNQALFAAKKREIVENYMEGLTLLSEKYSDRDLLNFVRDLENSDTYRLAFNKTVKLAEMRNVPEEMILKNKKDIDDYFQCKE